MRLPLALALLAALALAGCSDGGTSTTTSGAGTSHGDHTHGSGHIELKDNEFVGGDQSLAKGTLAHFENIGSRPHTVTIHKAGEPASTLRHDARLAPGASTQYAFADAGTYHVWCTLHGEMTSGMAMVVTVS